MHVLNMQKGTLSADQLREVEDKAIKELVAKRESCWIQKQLLTEN